MSAPVPVSAKIGVVGAGAMGGGIAMVAAAAGRDVVLYDADGDALIRAMARVTAEQEKLVARGKLAAEESAARLARLRTTDRIEGLAGASLVVEAIVEDIDIKGQALARVEHVLGDDAILATNTSSLSVTALGTRLRRPERFAGLHFFNPATLMRLVEIVRGAATDAAVVSTLVETAADWGKVPVVCRSTPGFIVNRIARPYYGEALRLLADGAASPATIDAILRDCGGFRMGPFELMDLIGHDVNLAVTRSVFAGFFCDPRYQPSILQQELVDAGHLGRKVGVGFYRYGADAAPAVADEAPAAASPARVVLGGSLGPAAALSTMIEARGIAIDCQSGDGRLVVDGAAVALTDGRTATERHARDGIIALFDLVLDWDAAPRIALAFADMATPAERAAATGLFQALGKRVSIIDDTPGMAVMRTVAMLGNEAADGLLQGLADARSIDLAMREGVNYPLGPLEWADRVGLNHIVRVLDALAVASPNGRYRASPLLRRRALSGGALLQ